MKTFNGISSVLAALMKATGLSENELSRQSNVNQPTIHRIFSGESVSPRGSTIQPLAKYFGITNAQLRGEAPLPKNILPKEKLYSLIDEFGIFVESVNSPAQTEIIQIQNQITHSSKLNNELNRPLLKKCMLAVFNAAIELDECPSVETLIDYAFELYDDPIDLNKPNKVKRFVQMFSSNEICT